MWQDLIGWQPEAWPDQAQLTIGLGLGLRSDSTPHVPGESTAVHPDQQLN